MPGKKPFKFRQGKNQNLSDSTSGYVPPHQNPSTPNRPYEWKNEWTVVDGNFRLHVRLTKATGYIEKGVFSKKKYFNAHLHVEPRGGNIVSLEATYQCKSGECPIKAIGKKSFDTDFNVPTDSFVGAYLKVTVVCKFKVKGLGLKPLSNTVYLDH